MTVPITPGEPWDDRRLEAAFAMRGSTIRTPPKLVGETVDRVRSAPRPAPPWRRWLPAAAVIVLAVGVAAGGLAISDQVRGRALFRPGPTADLRTLDTGEFAFDYPTSWLAYDASVSSSGGSSIAVLGTLPVERRCGDERHVDINCVYQQRLEPGQVRLHVGTGTYRDGAIQDLPINEIGRITRVEVGGMPALVTESDGSPDSYYREDKSLHWEIARPGTDGTGVVELEARLTEPGVAEGLAQLEALIASFRFTNGPDHSVPPTPEPTPTATPPRLAELRVMTVEELIAATMSPTPDEVVVRGWLSRSNVILDCNVEPDPHPLIPLCGEFGLFLWQDAPFVERGTLEPHLPHVVPMLRIDAHAAVPAMPGIADEVLAMGHLLDHRWTTCSADAQIECKKRFVIDRVVDAARPIGDDLPTPWASPMDLPVDGAVEAVEVLSSVVGGVRVVSIGIADPDALRSIEWQTRANPDLQTSWLVRALVGGDAEPVARTFLVGDEGHPTAFEVTESGVVDLIGQPSSEPPTEVLDLPVISVEEAIAIRDAGRDDREIAVLGWFSPSGPIPCPYTPVTSPVQPVCPDPWVVLMQDPQSLVTRLESGFEGRPPSGPSFEIDLDDIDPSWEPVLPKLGPAVPIQIIAVGHFDDRRSGFCPAGEIDACRDRFVVDRVERAGGATQPMSVTSRESTDVPPFATTEAAVTAAVPGPAILSAALWPAISIGDVEPALREGRAGITDQDSVWVIRVLRDERAVTYLVVDGTDRIFEMTSDGEAVDVSGPAAG